MSVISLYLLFSMGVVIVIDMTRYMIPNWLVGSLLMIYPIMLYVAPAPVDWQGALTGMAICFVTGYLLFLKRWMGGGDIKLIVACSLWVGLVHLVDFLFLMTVIGGLFSLLLLAGRKILAAMLVEDKRARLPRLLQVDAPVPYGVAIAGSFLYMMWAGQVAGFTFS